MSLSEPSLGKHDFAINTLVTLNGSTSSDVNGDALIYKWSLISRPTANTAVLSSAGAEMPTIIVDVTGSGVSYVAQLIVNDGQVDNPPDTVIINTANTRPVADAGTNLVRFVRETVEFNGNNFSDVDPLCYQWTLVCQPPNGAAGLLNSASAVPSFVANRVGTYQTQLVVNDGTVNSSAFSAKSHHYR